MLAKKLLAVDRVQIHGRCNNKLYGKTEIDSECECLNVISVLVLNAVIICPGACL